MHSINGDNSNIYVSDNLFIQELVDRNDCIYYPGDEIEFTIICINNSNDTLNNILIKDILPATVIPSCNDEYFVTTTKGEVTQKNNEIIIKIDKLIKMETVIIKIKGIVKE